VVTAIAATIGIVPLLAAMPVLHARFTAAGILWGALAGLAGSMGVLLLYTALAVGPMSVLSPVTSVLTALVPVVVAVATGTRLTPLTTVAIAAAVVAVVLVATSRNTSGARVTTRGLLIAVAAGCGFGALVLAYNATDAADGIAPLVVARVVQAVLMWCGVLVMLRRAAGAPRPAALALPEGGRFWLILVCCGLFDASANVFIQAGLHSGASAATLPVISVLNALYPIGTIVLAAIVLRERLTAVQLGGLVLAFAASVTLAVS
jgi:drug/metabolite transporter (DMT)-like permease